MTETLATLPPGARGAFKDRLGPVFTDVDALLADGEEPIVAVGDVTTYHLRKAGRQPDVAVVDGRSEREPVAAEVADAVSDTDAVTVENQPGTISRALVEALTDALDADEPRTIFVEGEEDLATVPALLLVPENATVVYGQPGEGMVRAVATPETLQRVRDLVALLEGGDRLLAAAER